MCLVKETFLRGTDPSLSLSWMFFGYDTKLKGWAGMYPVDGNKGLMESAQRWNQLVLPKVDTAGWTTSWKFKCQRDRFLVVGVMGSRCCCPNTYPSPTSDVSNAQASSEPTNHHHVWGWFRAGSWLAWTLESFSQMSTHVTDKGYWRLELTPTPFGEPKITSITGLR